eukprot:1766429-Rhodomonas_salina.1
MLRPACFFGGPPCTRSSLSSLTLPSAVFSYRSHTAQYQSVQLNTKAHGLRMQGTTQYTSRCIMSDVGMRRYLLAVPVPRRLLESARVAVCCVVLVVLIAAQLASAPHNPCTDPAKHDRHETSCLMPDGDAGHRIADAQLDRTDATSTRYVGTGQGILHG